MIVRWGLAQLGPLLDCVRAYATLGEIVEVMKSVFGTYEEHNWV